MESIIAKRTGDRPLKFKGELLASQGTSLNNACSNYSGSTGHAQNVEVYKTAKGKFVVATHHITQWQGEHDTDGAEVFASKADVVSYLKEHLPGFLLEDIVKELGEEEVAEEIE